MAWWPLGRNRRDLAAAGAASTAASAEPRVAARVSVAAEPEGAWRDLPSVQRTLAEPLRPVAIGDDFPQSLATFNDPSFVAPLSHQVDPSTGGLVDGLASAGQPYTHPNGSDLPVPARPAAEMAPRVQRSVAWSGSSDLPTVGWELPGPADELPVEPNPELPPMTSGQVEPTTPGSASVAAPVPAAASAPDRGLVSAPQVQVPVQRSLAAVPATPAPKGVVPPIALGELPIVVARSIANAPMPEVRAAPGPPDAPDAPDAPVSQVVEPTEHAPLSGFAAAITSLAGSAEVPARPPDGLASGGGTGDRLAAGPSVQRLKAEVEAPNGPDSVPDAPVDPPLYGSAVVASLPVVSRLVGQAGAEDSSPPVRAGEPSLARIDSAVRVEDAPTLGLGQPRTALAVQRAALTGRVAVPAEAPVQRVEFLPPQIAADPRPARSRSWEVAAADPEPVAGPNTELVAAASPSIVATPTATHAPLVQRSLEGSGPSAVSAASAMAEIPRASFPIAPVPVQRSVEVGLSNEAVDATGGLEAASEIIAQGAEVAPGPPAGPPDLPAPTTPPDHRDFSEPVGPAVTAEPWVPAPTPSAPASAAPPSSVQNPSFQPRFTPAPAVQTSLASAPLPAAVPRPPRPVGSGPTVAVGPPLPVQRSAAHLTEAAAGHSSSSSPLIVSRQPVDNVSLGASPRGGTMSFATMFGSADVPQSAETAASADSGFGADGFTSVQLQSDTASAPSESAASVPAPSTGPPPAAPATPPTDLDEMARRLYEPLSARLRAELWLDRERAGVMSDA